MPEWSGQPAYKQVAHDLRRRIRDGRLKAGEQLPSMAVLMQEFDVSITVVRMALAELRSDGLIATHQGKGAFVLDGAASVEPSDIEALQAEVRELSKRVAALESSRGRKASR